MLRQIRVLAAILFAATLAAGQGAPRLLYEVEVRDDDFDAFHHALEIFGPDRAEVALSVAAWAPGSYRLMNAAKQIKDVVAVDERGAARAVTHPNDLTWVVDSKGATRITVRWTFDKPGRGVNNRSYLTQHGGLLDGPRNYLYWRDHKELPAHVRFKLPADWKVGTGLSPTFDPMVFTAKNADWLLDCPVLLGKIETWNFEVKGVPCRVAYDNQGKAIPFDPPKVVDCVRRIVVAASDIMGGVPYEHYTFIYSNGGGGGLEHLTSTTIGTSSTALRQNPNALQGVTAHEFFHTWNVKRLRPKALGPFDYDGPVRTKSLWISEGLTSYYANIILARAGLMSEEQFISSYDGTISGFVGNPASRVISPEEASWTVWDSAYLSGAISYYTQGEILGLLMDLEIRGRTENAKCLDDAMRLMFQRFSGPVGFQSEDVVTAIYDATGVDLHDFFLRHVSSAQEIDWGHYFRFMGCTAAVTKRVVPAVAFEVTSAENGVAVRVDEQSAFGRAGLKTGDVVLAVDGVEVGSGGALTRALRRADVGQKVAIKIRRATDEKTIEVTIPASPDSAALRLRAIEDRIVIGSPPSDSALEKSGFMGDDQIVAVNGTAISNLAQARAALAVPTPGDVVKVTVRRSGVEKVIEHRTSPRIVENFKLELDPKATPLELEIRRSLIGERRVAESRSR